MLLIVYFIFLAITFLTSLFIWKRKGEKHLKILSECGLVIIQQQGRERFCEARLERLSEVSDWVEQYREVWTKRFDNLEDYLKELQSKNKKHGRKKTR